MSNRDAALRTLSLLFVVLRKIRREGLMSVEADVESSSNGIISRFPDADSAALTRDLLRLLVGGTIDARVVSSCSDAFCSARKNLFGRPPALSQAVGAALASCAEGFAPQTCVEIARIGLPPSYRPSFNDLERACSSARKEIDAATESVAWRDGLGPLFERLR